MEAGRDVSWKARKAARRCVGALVGRYGGTEGYRKVRKGTEGYGRVRKGTEGYGSAMLVVKIPTCSDMYSTEIGSTIVRLSTMPPLLTISSRVSCDETETLLKIEDPEI